MAKGRQRDLQLERYWRKRLLAQRQSGLSIRAFCGREGVPESAFRAWQRIIRERDQEQRRPEHGQATLSPAFLPLVVADADGRDARDADAMPITIELRGGRVMRLPASLPTGQLVAVLRAVEEAA